MTFARSLARRIARSTARAIAPLLMAAVLTSAHALPTPVWTASAYGLVDGEAYAGCSQSDRAARSQVLDGAGNVYVTGCVNAGGISPAIVTHKVSAATGAILWSATFYGGVGQAYARAIALDGAGHVIVTGTSFDFSGEQNIRTIKYNGATGATIWNVAYNGDGNGSDVGHALAVDAAGNVAVTGNSTDSAGGTNMRTIKYDGASGAILWTASVSGNSSNFEFETGNAVAVDASGHVFVTGHIRDAAQDNNIRTVKYDGATGAVLWSATFNGPVSSGDAGNAIAIDGAGHVIVTGTSIETSQLSSIRTIKYHGVTGAELWSVAYNGSATGSNVGHALALDAAGNGVVTGYSTDTGQGENIRTIKYNSVDGALLWTSAFNGSSTGNNDRGYSVAVDAGGNVAVSGKSIETGVADNIRTILYNGVTGAQIWSADYNGSANFADSGAAVAFDSGGNVLVSGFSTDTVGGANMRTLKYSAAGALLWAAKENPVTAKIEAGGVRAMAVDTAGNVAVTGSLRDDNDGDKIFTAKISSATGAVLWSAIFNGSEIDYDGGQAVAFDSAGNVFVTGFSNEVGEANNIRTIKYDGATGAQLWSASFNGSANGNDIGNAIAIDSAGDVLVTGRSHDAGSNFNIRTLKYNGATGAQIWSAAFNGSTNGADIGNAIALDSAGNVFVTGTSTEIDQFVNIRTVKYNGATGAQMWAATVNGSANNDEISFAIAIDAAGNAVVTGGSQESGQGYNIRTIKYDGATGTELWNSQFNGALNANDIGRAVAIDASGHVLVTGNSRDAGSGDNIRTIKYHGATGAQLWSREFSGSIPTTQRGSAIALDAAGHVLVTGFSNDAGSLQNIRTLRYHGTTGNLIWTTTSGGTAGGDDAGYAVAAAAGNTIYVMGSSVETGMPRGILVQKMTDTTTLPGAPTIGTATAGAGLVSVFFTPGADGGSTIIDYTATCGVANQVVGTASPIVVTGLANGMATSCTLAARNALGSGPASTPSNSVTPRAVSSTFITGPSGSVQGVSNAFTATVTGASPTGTILFKDGAATIAGCGALALSFGSATCNTAALPLGARSLTAEYSGDAANQPSVSPAFAHAVVPVDTAPDVFSFTTQSNVAFQSVRTSDTITVTGTNSPAAISVSGGTYSIGCSGTFTASAGSIAPGATVCVRHTSSNLATTAATTILTIGGVVGTFTSVTGSGPMLTASRIGTGSGTVTSNPAGINCGASCSATFANSPVTLTATPAANSTFVAWTGTFCSAEGGNTSPTCTFGFNSDISVSAEFAVNTHALTIVKTGTGSGTVQSAPFGIDCGATCTANFADSTVVQLLATASTGSTFIGWSGVAGCAGSTLCNVTMNQARTATAIFTSNGLFTLNLEGAQEPPPLAVTGTGSGTATVDTVAKTITLNVTFSGATGAITSAHLHGPAARGSAAGIKIALTDLTSPISEVLSYNVADENDLLSGQWYLNLHTTANPGGELRAQLDNIGPADKLLSVVIAGSGTVTSSPAGINCPGDCSESFVHNTVVTLTPSPILGATFLGFSGGGCSGTAPCDVTMDLVKSVTANFSVTDHAVTATAGANGSITPALRIVTHGGTTTFTVTPDAGYVAVVAGCGGSLNGTTYTTGPITAPCTVNATFVALIVFELTPEGAQEVPPLGAQDSGGEAYGSATVNTVARTIKVELFHANLTGPVTAANLHGPAARGATAGVKIPITNISNVTNSIEQEVSYDQADEADILAGLWYINLQTAAHPNGEMRAQLDNLGFVNKTITVSKAGSGTGTVTGTGINCGADCSESYPHDAFTTITLTATPAPGSVFAGWGGDCAGVVGPQCSMAMYLNYSVSATFDVASYTVAGDVTPAAAGSISCSNPVTHGNTTTCTALGNVGYTLTGISGCGGTPGTTNPYTTGAITANCTVTAQYVLRTYVVNGVANPSNGSSVTCASPVNHGSTTTCLVTPISGYSISSVSGCGAGNLSGNTYTTGTITSACTVVANFTPITHVVTAVASPPAGGTVSCGSPVNEGLFTSCSATANAGYALTGLSGCGGVASTMSPYVTGTITSPCTVNATFASVLALDSVFSRKLHAGNEYDVPINPNTPLNGSVDVEPRAIGAGHRIVFRFNAAVAQPGNASSTLGSASAAVNPNNANEVIVTLTSVPDNVRTTVSLDGVNGATSFGASLGFLVGDVNSSRSVNATDISGVKARSGQTTNASNFRFDLNASGGINATDIAAVKARSGLVLP